jgi:hypothetical protein
MITNRRGGPGRWCLPLIVLCATAMLSGCYAYPAYYPSSGYYPSSSYYPSSGYYAAPTSYAYGDGNYPYGYNYGYYPYGYTSINGAPTWQNYWNDNARNGGGR